MRTGADSARSKTWLSASAAVLALRGALMTATDTGAARSSTSKKNFAACIQRRSTSGIVSSKPPTAPSSPARKSPPLNIASPGRWRTAHYCSRCRAAAASAIRKPRSCRGNSMARMHFAIRTTPRADGRIMTRGTERWSRTLARDILAAAMRRIEAAGYPIVLTVHDEIVCEVPEGFGNLEEFHHLMVELPAWAEGLPLAAKVWTRPRYAKATIVADKPSALPLEPISATPPISILPPESEIDTKAEVDVHTVEIKVGIDDGDEDGAHRGA